MLKVLDFSADIDHQPDSNGEFTGAVLEAGFLAESFTICSAFMVEAWITKFKSAYMFTMLGNGIENGYGNSWGRINMVLFSSYTQYEVWLGQAKIIKTIPTAFFPLQ